MDHAPTAYRDLLKVVLLASRETYHAFARLRAGVDTGTEKLR